jgi:hypothetical protein
MSMYFIKNETFMLHMFFEVILHFNQQHFIISRNQVSILCQKKDSGVCVGVIGPS